jgi:hypothetical protein
MIINVKQIKVFWNNQMVKTQYTFIKVPNDPEIKNKYPLKKDFGYMEELYLELLENKLKIKPELIGKPFKLLNSEFHNNYRNKFNTETSRTDFDNQYEYEDCDSEETEGESGSDVEEFPEYEKYIQSPNEITSEHKPWVSTSYKRHDIPTLGQIKHGARAEPEESSENQEDKKRELLFKFEILKKSYKNHADKIPVCTI